MEYPGVFLWHLPLAGAILLQPYPSHSLTVEQLMQSLLVSIVSIDR